jgi:hypothetical protein
MLETSDFFDFFVHTLANEIPREKRVWKSFSILDLFRFNFTPKLSRMMLNDS